MTATVGDTRSAGRDHGDGAGGALRRRRSNVTLEVGGDERADEQDHWIGLVQGEDGWAHEGAVAEAAAAQLAHQLFDETGYRTRMLLGQWIGQVLGPVQAATLTGGKPPCHRSS